MVVKHKDNNICVAESAVLKGMLMGCAIVNIKCK